MELQLRRCVTTGARTLHLTSLPLHICSLGCMHRHDCLFTNYNVEQNYCISIDVCMEWEVNNEFELRYFGLPRQKCLSWTPVSLFHQSFVLTDAGPLFTKR